MIFLTFTFSFFILAAIGWWQASPFRKREAIKEQRCFLKESPELIDLSAFPFYRGHEGPRNRKKAEKWCSLCGFLALVHVAFAPLLAIGDIDPESWKALLVLILWFGWIGILNLNYQLFLIGDKQIEIEITEFVTEVYEALRQKKRSSDHTPTS